MPDEPKSHKKNESVLVGRWSRDPGTPRILDEYPDHARLIGLIIAEWAHIEWRLVFTLQNYFEDDALAVESMLFTVESSRARLQVLQIGFAHVLSQDVLPRAELLIKRAGEILKLRNRYAHAIYGKDNDSKELAIVTRGRKIHTVNIPLHELKHHLEQMRALSHDIGVMMLDTMPPPLPIPHELVSAPRHLTERSPGHTAPAPPEPPPPSPESPEAQSSEPPAL